MEQFITDVVELFDEKPDFEINENTIFKDLSGWDSLVSLSLLVMVLNNYEKSIDGETIRNCITIRDLFEVVNA